MGRNAVREWIEVEYYRARSQNHRLAVVWLIRILSFCGGRDRGNWWERQCRSMSSSSKDTVDNYPCFISQLKCHKNGKKRLDALLATDAIPCQLVHGKSRNSIDIIQTQVLPLSYNFSHPPSHVCKVFNWPLNFNIPLISKPIPHLHSSRHSKCIAPSQDPPTPIVWFMVVTCC